MDNKVRLVADEDTGRELGVAQQLHGAAMKTTTLWYDESNPMVSLLEGKHTATSFNKAFRAEGWDGDWIHKENLRFEYWRSSGSDGSMRRCEKGEPGAKLCTVTYW